MSADFSNHLFFVGAADADRARASVITGIRQALRQAGYQEMGTEMEAERSLVIGPSERWIFIGDSAGSTDEFDSEAFEALSRQLSTLGPVVDTIMSDDAAVHFYLYRQGRLIDEFGNAAFPFFRFVTEEEAAPYRGRPELWADLLLSADDVPTLRAAWVQDWEARQIVVSTARLFGWNPALSWVGYTHDDEGAATKYNEFLRHSGLDLGAFEELHFKRWNMGEQYQ